MKTIKLLFVLITMAYASVALGVHCPVTSNVIADPETFVWTLHPVTANNPEAYYSGTLEIGEASFTIGTDTITTRAYRQAGSSFSIPGPTIKMVPGNKYVLQFKNLLPYEVPSIEHNIFKDPNISNLHTHGVHISGESPGDDVTRIFEGGFAGDFVYDIPADHMGGTYWYHAHHHGSTYLQVSGGAFGMILIDDGLDVKPDNVRDMEERQLVIAYLDPGVAGTGGDTLISGTLSPTWTTNGTIAGNFCVPPDTWQHWRILLADRDAKPKTVAVGDQCQVAVMAQDGVWRLQVPLDLPGNSISLTGASRADLAVRCSSDSTISVGNTVVANVNVDENGTADPSVHPYNTDGVSTWPSVRPLYLRDLRGEAVADTHSINMGARTVNGDKFDANVATFPITANGVQELSIKGARQHPFHLHIYHMQMIGNCGAYEDGEYYDTVAGNCTVRFDVNALNGTAYDGRTIMHCHILEHEDQGAMGWIDVDGGTLPPTYPVDGDVGFSYQDYYSF